MAKGNLLFNASVEMYVKGDDTPKKQVTFSMFSFGQLNEVQNTKGEDSELDKLNMIAQKGDFMIGGFTDQSKAVIVKNLTQPKPGYCGGDTNPTIFKISKHQAYNNNGQPQKSKNYILELGFLYKDQALVTLNFKEPSAQKSYHQMVYGYYLNSFKHEYMDQTEHMTQGDINALQYDYNTGNNYDIKLKKFEIFQWDIYGTQQKQQLSQDASLAKTPQGGNLNDQNDEEIILNPQKNAIKSSPLYHRLSPFNTLK